MDSILLKQMKGEEDMKSFINDKLIDMNVPMRLVRLIGTINEYKGKQDLYIQQSPQVLEGHTLENLL